MHPIDLQSAAKLIDFSGGQRVLQPLARQQLDGAVALHNILARQNVAYLADEVGMGKTYIALGVAAMMRRFAPGLRVLYLLPKNNVRDKWEKDYRSFVKTNYLESDLRVKGLNGAPAARYAVCRSLYDLIQSVATDSARDFFICSSAFSLPLGNTASDLHASLQRFSDLLPQAEDRARSLQRKIASVGSASGLDNLKREVKSLWASTLRSVLPTFDLVVVDEAHNFRRGSASADRNALIAEVLGSSSEANTCKARRVLMLSATPFDRNINDLLNQFSLFGKPGAVSVTPKTPHSEVLQALAPVMVRRLNTIKIGGGEHTRNMYRDEHRTGERAEVKLRVEQQLFAALLQKKVSEHLEENLQGRFELGMLASFESYLPGEKNRPVQFDGTDDNAPAEAGGERDAQDRNIVEWLVHDYHQCFNEMPPHPKMDSVAADSHKTAFKLGKKRLIFARRIRSVSELKLKLESEYDAWLGDYIENDKAVHQWWHRYRRNRKLNHSLSDEATGDDGGDSTGSSFFTWFYRGKNAELEKASSEDLGTLPFNFRSMLTSTSAVFELNWSMLPGMPEPSALPIDWAGLVPRRRAAVNQQSRFENAQFAYLQTVANGPDRRRSVAAQRILNNAFPHFQPGLDLPDPASLANDLGRQTFWNQCTNSSQLASLFPDWTESTFQCLCSRQSKSAEERLKRLLIHQRLGAVICRLDHPFIDLYSLRDTRRDDISRDEQLAIGFAKLLVQQAADGAQFSSFTILRDLAQNLDLLIKLNFEDAYSTTTPELTRYLVNQIAPLSPVIGATGENSPSRSPMARKFRMPGYPRILVSTDVFQEGEDLHTFCDQVIHYGIPASPIAIEQKIGRVDRVASLAHRNLQACSSDHGTHFIQVYFPHVRASLEYLQVRKAAQNLNDFQRSLHTLGAAKRQYDSSVSVSEQLRDDSEIPPQIRDRLWTPFPVRPIDLGGRDQRKTLQIERTALAERLQHVRESVEACLSDVMGRAVMFDEGLDGLIWHSNESPRITLQLRGSVGLPELILSVQCDEPIPFELESMQFDDFVRRLQVLQRDPLARLRILNESQGRGAVLLRDAQIYAGTRLILVEHEIRDTFNRVAARETVNRLAPAEHELNLDRMLARLAGKTGAPPQVSMVGARLIRYHFEEEGRTQDVRVQVLGGHAVVSSVALDAEGLKLFEDRPKFILELTLGRNSRFDAIDFHIDDLGGLAVRAAHPIEHLDQPELEFMTTMVAAEADRLEHMLTCGDDDADEAKELAQAGSGHATVAVQADLNDASVVMCTIRDVLERRAFPRDVLIREAARKLGYRRTGKNIADALNGHLIAAVRRGIAKNENGTVSLCARSISDYDRDFLKTQFLAALSAHSSGFVQRDDAVQAWARWLGYERTGPVIKDHARSLINGLLRERRLEANGDLIRRGR